MSKDFAIKHGLIALFTVFIALLANLISIDIAVYFLSGVVGGILWDKDKL